MKLTGQMQMIWGPGPLPADAEATGFVRHPTDGMIGVAIQMPTGITVHGAAGVIRNMEPGVKQYPSLQSAYAANLGKLGGSVASEAQKAAARRNAKRGGWPKGRPRKIIYTMRSICPACRAETEYQTILKKVIRKCADCGYEWEEETPGSRE